MTLTWEKVAESLGSLLLASLAWLVGLATPATASAANDGAGAAETMGQPPGLMLAWAQEIDASAIAQVDEGGEDVETLDEGALPAAQPETTTPDSMGAAEGDVETLDQGSPPAAEPAAATTEPAAAPVETVAAAPAGAPVTTYGAPVAAGPAIPEDFGTGNVHVVTGGTGFPIGLEPCHVGAVTGRAYVGLDCGDEESSFVGHAPSFDDFPFVLEEEFPFDDEEVAAQSARGGDANDDPGVFVTAARTFFGEMENASVAPLVETSGRSSVDLVQKAKDREPRVRVAGKGAKRSIANPQAADNEVRVARQKDNDDRSRANANNRGRDDRAKSGNGKKENKHNAKSKSKKQGTHKKGGNRNSSKKRSP